MRKQRAIPLALLALAGVVAAAPAPAAAAISDAVIIALNSVKIDRDAAVLGDVVVNDAATQPTLEPGYELAVDRGVEIDGNVLADSVDIDGKATVNGSVECNDGSGACSGLDLPVFDTLPTFRVAVPGDGSGANCAPQGDCSVSGIQTLAPGAYRHITIGGGATLVLDGGGYDAASVEGAAGSAVRFDGASMLRVAGDIAFGSASSIVAGAGLSGRDLLVHGGGNASFGKSAVVEANVYLETGLFHLDRGSSLTGSIIAVDADFDKDAELVLDSAFNLAPVADPQTVLTLGTDPIDIVLTGSDADGDDLVFSIVAGPTAGTITAGPTQLTTTSARVTYDAVVEGAMDQFVFRVEDGGGGSDNAVVDINPSDDPPDPPVLAGILAKDATSEAIQGVPTQILLVAAAPQGQDPGAIGDLTFSISSGPAAGNTVSPPVPANEGPVRSATVTYTAAVDFSGTDSFVFEACDAADLTNCDLGAMTVNVDSATPPAPPVGLPQSVTTSQGTTIEINLAVPAGQEEPSSQNGRDDPCGNGELDPGEECDDGNRLNGDGCDDQCNSEPQ